MNKYILLLFSVIILFLIVILAFVINGNEFSSGEKAAYYSALCAFAMIFITLFISVSNSKENYYNKTFEILLSQVNKELNELKNNSNYKNMVKEILFSNYEIDDKCNSDYKVRNLTGCNNILHKYDSIFGAFFRILYRTLKHIEINSPYYFKSGFDKEKFLSGIVRSFIQHDILLLLAINCGIPNSDR